MCRHRKRCRLGRWSSPGHLRKNAEVRTYPPSVESRYSVADILRLSPASAALPARPFPSCPAPRPARPAAGSQRSGVAAGAAATAGAQPHRLPPPPARGLRRRGGTPALPAKRSQRGWGCPRRRWGLPSEALGLLGRGGSASTSLSTSS